MAKLSTKWKSRANTYPDMIVFRNLTSQMCFLRQLLQDVVWQTGATTRRCGVHGVHHRREGKNYRIRERQEKDSCSAVLKST